MVRVAQGGAKCYALSNAGGRALQSQASGYSPRFLDRRRGDTRILRYLRGRGRYCCLHGQVLASEHGNPGREAQPCCGIAAMKLRQYLDLSVSVSIALLTDLAETKRLVCLLQWHLGSVVGDCAARRLALTPPRSWYETSLPTYICSSFTYITRPGMSQRRIILLDP